MLLTAISALTAVPAHASFPGHNGRFVFAPDYVWTANPDGSGFFQVTNPPSDANDSSPKWSPDGQQIAFIRYSNSQDDRVDIHLVNGDGTGLVNITQGLGGTESDPAWSPNGSQLVFDGCAPGCSSIYVINVDGSGLHKLAGPAFTDEVRYVAPKWSPDGTKIAFLGWRWDGVKNLPFDIYTINPDGTGLTDITNTPSFDEQSLDWSPDGSRIVFDGQAYPPPADSDVYVMNRDGSGKVDITQNASAYEDNSLWSPDGSRILFHTTQSPAGFYLMNPDGTSRSLVEGTGVSVKDWQPIPISYARPKGATPTRIALVTANNQCTAPNRTHGAPLAFPSCAPAQLSSGQLTVGTGDSNARPALMQASLRFDVSGGDVTIAASLNDVFKKDLSDYTGTLRASVAVQITDKGNTPNPGGPGPGTVQPFPLQFDIGCGATADPNAGSNCMLNTTMNALQPGALVSGRRSIWELGQAKVFDGNGGLFAVEGVFVP